MREPDREGDADARLPWAFVLDPAANARALGEVQRRGLSAARELVDRVTSAMDGPDAGPRTSGGVRRNAQPNGAGWATPQTDLVNQLVQGWWELTLNTLTAFTGNRPTTDRSSAPREVGSITVDATRPLGPVSWHLAAATDGRLVDDGELWLQNPSADPLGAVRLSIGDLRAESGAVIASGAVGFDPSRVRSIPARSARCVLVDLTADQPIVPGSYRGLLEAEGATRFSLPIEIAVA